ncbi:hypothetical protein KHA80_08265 [Anaerobacillus sp. HL2]|nr:hypothetical protein KHA80_08265 [Anaerobacillus sp. HL2]
MEMEKKVYEILGESTFSTAVYYGSGSNYLILSYEKGETLYDCLLKVLSSQVIADVEGAREYALSEA